MPRHMHDLFNFLQLKVLFLMVRYFEFLILFSISLAPGTSDEVSSSLLKNPPGHFKH